MKIVFTGGGSGGHFYPIIAVAEALKEIEKEKKLLPPELFYFNPDVFDERALFEQGITHVPTSAGKMRRYFSILNIFDMVKTGWGIFETIIKLYTVFPDVVFSKGGYGSVPTLIAAKLLGIPVIAHDSDAIPGRATLMAAPFAKRIAIAYDEAFAYFPDKMREKIALTGNPIRRDVASPAKEGSQEFLELEANLPVILVIGGSLGAESINNAILEALPALVNRYQVIHQTGQVHFESVKETARVVLEKNERRYRYKPYGFLNTLALKMSAGAADLVISRAGSGMISEIASWGKPSILIPIPEDVSRDQRSNAFAYAHTGSCVVIEQNNLTPNVLMSEIDRLFTNPKARTDLADSAKKFAKKDAAHQLAEAIIDAALEHEK